MNASVYPGHEFGTRPTEGLESVRHDETVGIQAEYQPTPTPLENVSLTLARFERLQRRWHRVNLIDLARAPYQKRVEIAKQCQHDADLCHALRTAPTSAVVQHARTPKSDKTEGRILQQEVDLRMASLFFVPEEMNDEKVENLVDAGIALSQRIGPSSERDLKQIDNLSKLHDIIALEALWMARGAMTEQEKAAAKVLLGSCITESVREIVSLTKRLEQSAFQSGEWQSVSGPLAEFMYITWERLHIYMHSDPDLIARVYVRSALNAEDRRSVDKNFSSDAIIMNLDRNYIRPQQYKTSETSREYNSLIQVVHIPGWWGVMDDIQQVARHFNTITASSSKPQAKEAAMAALDGYFARPNVLATAK